RPVAARSLPGITPPDISQDKHPACSSAQPEEGFAQGMGKATDPYVICTVAQLKRLDALPLVSTHYVVLGDNIDFHGERLNAPIDLKTVHLDGRMHSISNYVMIDAERDDVSLFSINLMANEPTIKNLVLVNPMIRGRKNVGALLGKARKDVSVDHVYLIGGEVWGYSVVGGLAGWGADEMSHVGMFGARVTVEGLRGGGIAGWGYNIKHAVVTGDVVATGPASVGSMGGIAGVLTGGRISQSLHTGQVRATGSHVGGI